jgi:hypothetical protein
LIHSSKQLSELSNLLTLGALIHATSKRWRSIVPLVAAALVCTGCNSNKPPLGVVHGTVVLDGRPLAAGAVITNFASGRGAQGAIHDGKFELGTYGATDGALIGTHRVAVIAREQSDGGPEAKTGKLLVPERYTKPETSDLSIEVKSGTNTPMLELTTK